MSNNNDREMIFYWISPLTSSVNRSFFGLASVKTTTAFLLLVHFTIWVSNLYHHTLGVYPEWVLNAEPMPTLLLCAHTIPLLSAAYALYREQARWMVPFITYNLSMIGAIVSLNTVWVLREQNVLISPFFLFSLVSLLVYTLFTSIKCAWSFAKNGPAAAVEKIVRKRRNSSINTSDLSYSAFGTPPLTKYDEDYEDNVCEYGRSADISDYINDSIFTNYGDEIIF